MYNKSEIMKAAWSKFNANKGRKVTQKVQNGIYVKYVRMSYTFSMALTAAWKEAKAAVKAAAVAAAQAAAWAAMTVAERIEKLENNMFNLNMTDRFDNSDRAQMDAWRNELAQLKAAA